MFGLYQMFVGDARPHERDTWLFHVIESMNDVIIPAVRMALKLHEVSVYIHAVTCCWSSTACWTLDAVHTYAGMYCVFHLCVCVCVHCAFAGTLLLQWHVRDSSQHL